ncbi:hypothetical protein KY363_00345 [Candidatus Woesearchaeota archaeon]|nr:hypothetical protein [Candidatus Woesearchaeota archaeon]
MKHEPDWMLLDIPETGGFKGTTYCIPAYLALAQFTAVVGENSGPSSIDVKYFERSGKDIIELTYPDNTRMIYYSDTINENLVREHVFFADPDDHTDAGMIIRQRLDVSYITQQSGHETDLEKIGQYVSFDSNPNNLTKREIEEDYQKIYAMYANKMRRSVVDMLGKQEAKEEAPQDDIPIIIVDTPVPEEIDREVTLAYMLVKKKDAGLQQGEDTERMEIPSGREAPPLTLENIADLYNPATGEPYSRSLVHNMAMMSLVNCMDDLKSIDYQQMIAVPPSKDHMLALDLGKKFDHLLYFKLLTQEALRPNDRERLLTLLGTTFKRSDLPADVKARMEEYFMTTGQKILSMDRYCTQNAGKITVHPLDALTPDSLAGVILPSSKTAAFFATDKQLIQAFIQHLINSSTMPKELVVDQPNHAINTGNTTVYLVGQAAKNTLNEYVDETARLRWTREHAAVEAFLRENPAKPVEERDLDAIIRAYLDITDPDKNKKR